MQHASNLRLPFRHGRVLVALAFTLLLVTPGALAWDGNWTEAKSGNDFYADPNSTDGTSGTPLTPLSFFTAPPRKFVDVDPDELNDYYKRGVRREYSPYALARISHDLHYNGITIPLGYYLIKAGDSDAGSPKTNLRSVSTSPAKTADAIQDTSLPPTLAEQSQRRRMASKSPSGAFNGGALPYPQRQAHDLKPVSLPGTITSNTTSVPSSTRVYTSPESDDSALSRDSYLPVQYASPNAGGNPFPNAGTGTAAQYKPKKPFLRQVAPNLGTPATPVFRTLVFKQLGRVIAVVPIEQVQQYQREKKEKVPNRALAWVEMDGDIPILHYYLDKCLYTTRFQ